MGVAMTKHFPCKEVTSELHREIFLFLCHEFPSPTSGSSLRKQEDYRTQCVCVSGAGERLENIYKGVMHFHFSES